MEAWTNSGGGPETEKKRLVKPKVRSISRNYMESESFASRESFE